MTVATLAKRRLNSTYMRWAPDWAKRATGHTVLLDIDLSVLERLRLAETQRLRDPRFLAQELLPALGLSDENPVVFPDHLLRAVGTGLRCWQYPNQLAPYLARLARYPIRSYLEIGVQHGGSFVITVEYLARFSPLSRAVAVDLVTAPGLVRYAADRSQIELMTVDSGSRRFRRFLEDSGGFDLVLIDGDHSRDACRHDVDTVLEHAGIIALHDIVDDPSPGVSAVWTDAKSRLHDEFNFYEYTAQYREVQDRTGQSLLGIGLAVNRRYEALAAAAAPVTPA